MYLRKILLIVAFLLVGSLSTEAKTTFKIGSLAPEGSIWITHFRQFLQDVEQQTGGEITFKLYPGGVMGDDMAMFRKIRAGQLHGGGFTMAGISKIVPDFQILAIPFLFQDYAEIDESIKRLTPFFREKYSEKGLELIGFTEVGLIYPMSSFPITRLSELKQSKSWSPSGDVITATYLQSLGVSPTPLTIPDVLSSLQTGLIDTVYTSLYGTIIMQWFNKVTYVTDTPFGYAYGAIGLSKKRFSRLDAKTQELIHSLADHHFDKLNKETRRLNEESKKVLLSKGVNFVASDPKSLEEYGVAREKTISKLKGKQFSIEGFEKVINTIEQVRQKR